MSASPMVRRDAQHEGRSVRPPLADVIRDERFRNYFASKVKRGADADCWEWSGYRKPGDAARRINIYGVACYGPHHYPAHRVAYALAHGCPDGDTMILHTCDNPPCCNPAHLVAGDQSKNMLHMHARERHPTGGARGTASPQAKLTEADVRTIRRRLAEGETCTAIAPDFGVTFQLVWLIGQRRIWAHVQ